MADKLQLLADEVAATPFQIPGATGEFRIQLLNEDTAAGVVTSIVHLPPGGTIPAHKHNAGPEMHYVLEGDMIEAGRSLGPGGFLTHPAGTVHGPHESKGGARVLTVQQWQSSGGSFDFELAEAGDEASAAAPGDAVASEGPAEAERGLGKGYG